MNIRKVTSPGNSLVKVFRRALADGLTGQGWLAVEGPHLLESALEAGPKATVQSVLVSRTGGRKFRGLMDRLPRQSEVAEIPDRMFEQVSRTQSPQGVAALVELEAEDLESILGMPEAILVVACGVQDPGNLGAMVRSARALGGTALITLESTVSPFNPKAARSSAGAIFTLPIFWNLKGSSLIERLHANKIRVVAADPRSPSPLAQADLKSRVAFLIGKEAAGLPAEIFRDADLRLSIPMRPGMDSVNAATAAGIFLYEAARQRGFKH